MVRTLKSNAEDKINDAFYTTNEEVECVLDEVLHDIVNKIESIRDDCHDEHFTLTDIADELDDLIKEIG